ncbi:hypothetical protein CHCC5027_2687 [Bacillus paralicheniformis]|uniref:hypothetical protein n=1 Tax=Bacillus paralicheniformis TaxID=1648923 RepID=UPI0011A6C783|nr:hypothetical protein [Bacillus paralicheniformis]TWJ39208.1 hypothetical protein CHCC5027_2687 [Bacillus paralicheniformis]
MPIEIPISHDYKLTSDERNIIVNERYFTDPTKAPNWPKRLAENPDLDPSPIARWREVAYFSSIDRAIMFVMDRRVKLSDANTLEDLERIIREFRRELAALLTVEGNRKD